MVHHKKCYYFSHLLTKFSRPHFLTSLCSFLVLICTKISQRSCRCSLYPHSLLDPFQPSKTSTLPNPMVNSLFSSYFMSKIWHSWSLSAFSLKSGFSFTWKYLLVSFIDSSCTFNPLMLQCPRAQWLVFSSYINFFCDFNQSYNFKNIHMLITNTPPLEGIKQAPGEQSSTR